MRLLALPAELYPHIYLSSYQTKESTLDIIAFRGALVNPKLKKEKINLERLRADP